MCVQDGTTDLTALENLLTLTEVVEATVRPNPLDGGLMPAMVAPPCLWDGGTGYSFTMALSNAVDEEIRVSSPLPPLQ